MACRGGRILPSMLRRVSSALAMAFALAASPAALAQTPGADVIVLKTGGMFRGTLVDVVPNDHARIRLSTGEVASVPWGEIDHIDASTSGPSAAPLPPAAPLPIVVTPPSAPADRVYVHMTGAHEATLERGNGRTWALVCQSPCDRWLPMEGGYRVSGPGLRSSTMFALGGTNGGRVDLDVDPASKGAFVGGIVATSVGYGVVPVGLLLMLVGAIVNSTDCDFDTGTSGSSAGCSGSSGSGLVLAGGITALVGAVVGTIGVVELASNVHSNVAQTVSDRQSSPPVSVRLPAWGDTTTAARAVAPAAPMTVPVYTLTF
jgi:hypothetical protein